MQSDFNEDIELAEQWALKAAANGHIEAMYWLGEGYTVYAEDVQQDDPEDARNNILKMLLSGSKKPVMHNTLPLF